MVHGLLYSLTFLFYCSSAVCGSLTATLTPELEHEIGQHDYFRKGKFVYETQLAGPMFGPDSFAIQYKIGNLTTLHEVNKKFGKSQNHYLCAFFGYTNEGTPKNLYPFTTQVFNLKGKRLITVDIILNSNDYYATLHTHEWAVTFIHLLDRNITGKPVNGTTPSLCLSKVSQDPNEHFLFAINPDIWYHAAGKLQFHDRKDFVITAHSTVHNPVIELFPMI